MNSAFIECDSNPSMNLVRGWINIVAADLIVSEIQNQRD